MNPITPACVRLGLLVLAGGLFVQCATAQSVFKREKRRPPNFIFVLSDDVAQGDLGCYGQKVIETPRLDEMAAEGTRFTQAYCGTSVCAPSRASFFTGLHTGHCPIRGNYEVPPEGQLPLPRDAVTIAEVAKRAGYATATIGKWGMGYFDTSGSPLKQGVDRFFGYNCQRHAHSYFPTYLYDNDRTIRLRGNDGRGVGEIYSQDLIKREMLDFIEANQAQPFFLFYAVTLPHGRAEIDSYGVYQNQSWSDKEKAYAAQVTRLDSEMGELMDLLERLKIDDDTLLVFAGDNGSSFDPKSDLGKRFNQAGNGLRGYKRSMYEGALRQAAIAWQPGKVPAGRVAQQPWAFWDLLPTFVEMSRARVPAGYRTDGFSMLDYFYGGDAPKRDHFYWELHLNKPIRAARWDDIKAVQNGLDAPVEIYDLKRDPGETTDLAAEKADWVARAQSIFVRAHEPDPNWPLQGRSAEHTRRAKEAWRIKRQRDRNTWVPPNVYRNISKTDVR
ncbi:MAG: arylsulfatase [Planctomycetota bacterium]